MDTSENEQIVFFDGFCTVCNGSVNFLMRLDHKKEFKYASLQSKKANELLKPKQIIGMDSVVLYKEQKIYTESDALVEIAKSLSWPWRVFMYCRFIPRGIRNAAYKLVANNRYRVFKRRKECRVPTEEERALFYD
ncbi:MAG: DUF393 domain-containing protein [Bacteroidia bacterium]